MRLDHQILLKSHTPNLTGWIRPDLKDDEAKLLHIYTPFAK